MQYFNRATFAAAMVVTSLAGVLVASTSSAQSASTDATIKEIEKYREALSDGNPAELWEARGEDLWKKKRGPKNASFEQCDIGLGPGIVKGAYTVLPKYFADTDKVEDLESRLVTCMVMLQGFKYEDAKKNPFGSPERKSDMEALASYISGASRGMKLNVSIKHPKEIAAYKVGEALFYRRAGSHDFSCANCHSDQGKRIRLQSLPILVDPKEAQSIYTTWPAYRVSLGTVRTMQHRLFDCYWQMRHPQLDYVSDTATALMVFMAKYANGGEVNAPALKR